MSLLKQVPNGGIIAWSESKKNNFLFAIAQTDINQDSNGELLLQILTFDAAEKGQTPNRQGATLMQVPATSITWSTFGEDTGKYPYGLICVGHQDGSLVIYDVNQIILSSKSSQQQLAYDVGKVCYIKEFNVPVYTVEYNSYKPNLIAIGGDEVLVVDISKDIENPDIIAPGDTNLHQGGNITSVSWNKKVPHILASASSNGVAVVWNLKTSQVSFQIPDIYQHIEGPKHLSLAWNPEIALQFAINYDDEKKPELHIWDLRDTRGPYVSLENGHVRGIQTLNWCTTDPSLMISGGVDNKIVIWNVKTKEIIQSFYLGAQIINVQWSKIPSLYSVTLSDGTIQLYALNSNELSAHPPKWYTPTVGATFAPSNVLTSFSEHNQSQLSSKQYQCKDENYQLYLRWFQELEKVIDDNNSPGLCDFKLKNTHVEDTFELDQWRLLKGVAYGNNKEILESLGFKKSDIIKGAEDYTGKKHKAAVEEDNNNTQKHQTKRQKTIEYTSVSEEQADEIFNNLTATNTRNQSQSINADLNGSQIKKSMLSNEEEVLYTEQVSKNKNWDAGVEKMIKENMIIGNYEGAIDCALKVGRVAEALLIAYSQNQDLFKSTVDQYFTQQTDNFIKHVFKNLIKNDIEDIAEHYDLKSWRECAGIAITCSKNPAEFQYLMNKLAERFVKEKNDDDSAICCFILSQNFQRLVEIYFKRIQALRGNIKQRAYYMVQSIQKLIILKKVMIQNQTQVNNRGVAQQSNFKQDANFDSILLELSKIALCNSRISTAYKILEQGNPSQLRIAELKDLLFNVYFDELSRGFTKPIVPYSSVRVPAPQYNPQHNQTNQANNQRNKQNQQAVKQQIPPYGNDANNKQALKPITQVPNNPVNPIVSPQPHTGGNRQHNVPFNPARQNQMDAPPPSGSSGKINAPPIINQNFNAPPIQNTPPVQNPPIQNTHNHPHQNEVPPFNQPPMNPHGYGANKDIKSGPPSNPNNKLFTEQLGTKNTAPPRPANNVAKFNPPINQNQAPPLNPHGQQNQSHGGMNVPPPISESRSPVSNSQNSSFAHNHPSSHPTPPYNAGQVRAPNNKNVPAPVNPLQNKQESLQTPPPINQQTRQGSNVPGAVRQNVPPPVQNVPPPVQNVPFNPNPNNFNPSQNQHQMGGNVPPLNPIAQTRPPITMNLNNPPTNPVNNNLPPTTNAPPPTMGGQTQSRTISQQAQNTYTASPQEIQLIEGYINNNMGIFGQIDPKKKEEHYQQLNSLINLLKSNQLKQEQVTLLAQIAQEMSSNNQKDALNTHSKLARIDFSTHKQWLTTLKRLIAQK